MELPSTAIRLRSRKGVSPHLPGGMVDLLGFEPAANTGPAHNDSNVVNRFGDLI
jgi:hypothetical protein